MIVKELLVHKTLSMPLRYSHLSPKYMREAVEGLFSNELSSDLDTFWTPEIKTENTEDKLKSEDDRLFDTFWILTN